MHSPWLKEVQKAGVRWVFLSNVDNVGATLSPTLLGAHRRLGRAITVEVVEGTDSGGVPIQVDGQPLLAEAIRLAPGEPEQLAHVSSTNTFVFDIEALAAVPPLTRLFVTKTVQQQPVVQIETLVGEWTRFHPTTFLQVPRAQRFVPVKTPQDLPAARRYIEDSAPQKSSL